MFNFLGLGCTFKDKIELQVIYFTGSSTNYFYYSHIDDICKEFILITLLPSSE